MIEKIDIPEFGWYELNVERYIPGITGRIIVSSDDPYLDDLGPRIRIDHTSSWNPADMIPVFIDNPVVPEGIISDEEVTNLLKFIESNRTTLLRLWSSSHGDCYDSMDVYNDLDNTQIKGIIAEYPLIEVSNQPCIGVLANNDCDIDHYPRESLWVIGPNDTYGNVPRDRWSSASGKLDYDTQKSVGRFIGAFGFLLDAWWDNTIDNDQFGSMLARAESEGLYIIDKEIEAIRSHRKSMIDDRSRSISESKQPISGGRSNRT